MEHLRMALRILQENQLVINIKKHVFSQPKLEYLGHIVSSEGVQVNPLKIKAMVDCQHLKAQLFEGFFEANRLLPQVSARIWCNCCLAD